MGDLFEWGAGEDPSVTAMRIAKQHNLPEYITPGAQEYVDRSWENIQRPFNELGEALSSQYPDRLFDMIGSNLQEWGDMPVPGKLAVPSRWYRMVDPTAQQVQTQRRNRADGGGFDDPTLPIPTMDNIRSAWNIAKQYVTHPTDPYEEAGKAVQQYHAGDPVGAFETMAGSMPQTGAIKAYHGSPHSFDKFDLSKIGTGEGAQMYGHGLYFAESPDVARGYRQKLSKPMMGDDAASLAARIWETTGGREGAIREANSRLASWEATKPQYRVAEGGDRFRSVINILSDPRYEPPESIGRMYEVGINAEPHHFLDYDKPMSEQPQAARDVLSRMILAEEAGKAERPSWEGADALTAAYRWANHNRDELAKKYGNEALYNPNTKPIIAKELNAAGVPGIRYFDQLSRDSGEGSRNYVVFDPSIVDILRKYADGGAVSDALRIAHQYV